MLLHPQLMEHSLEEVIRDAVDGGDADGGGNGFCAAFV